MSTLYGKVEDLDHQRLITRRKTIQRVIVITLSSILLLGIVVAAVAGTRGSAKDNDFTESSEHLSSSIKAVCNVTLYPDSCYSSLSPEATSGKPLDLFKLSMQVALKALQRASEHFTDPFWTSLVQNGNMTKSAVDNCKLLLDIATDHLNGSLSAARDLSNVLHSFDDLKTWLSSAATCQVTCFDGFEFESQEIQSEVTDLLRNSTELTSNSLAIVNFVSTITGSLKLGRKLLTTEDEPEWLSAGARRLMSNATLLTNIANITVSKDGKGNFTSISAALGSVPDKSSQTVIIYVKKGVYLENVVVGSSKWNVVMMGDGANKTIVSGSLNFVDGTPTFSSATFSVFGKGFMAKDMGFWNTAGASKHQAVALLSMSDMSVFYQCSFNAFQDTLYTHSNRQFYRKCDIIGTVDFIFGNAAVVIQTSNLLPRRPDRSQMNILTAQGKTDPNMNTGTSIQGCTVRSFDDLTGVKTYLGRPWKDFSTSVFIRTSLSNIIDPKGWLPWIGTTVPDTIFYAEYLNTGDGAVTKDRVTWKGLKLNLTSKAAGAFTVKSFIQGDKWIPAGVAYNAGL